jgi:hypothetical protein
MAQHDYILDNQSGANFRADLNNALLAISSNNSGATQPSTMYAYEWWIDTSNNLLKLRNSGNSDWITLPISITADNTVDINGGTVNGISSFSLSSGSTITTILDEDDFSSNSATALATQQSIKAYIDSQVTAQDLDISDGSSTIAIDLDSETLSLLGGTGVTAAASGNGVTFSIGQDVATSSNVVFNQVTSALVGNASTATALQNARTINGTSFDGTSNISFDTDSVSEGSSNLYFTNARARAAISESSTQLSYNSSTGVLTYTQGDTDTVSEGSSNLYHTTARVQAISINNVVEDTTPQLGGSLDVNGQDIVSVSDGNITLTPNGTGVVRIDGSTGVDIQQGAISIKNGGTQSYIDFYCESSNAHYARLQAPAHASFAGNITLTLPATTGTIALTSSSITGNSATATALQNARTISGVSFDGTSNITLDTDDIGEGSSNLYYTDARSNAAIDARVTNTFINNLSGVVADTATALATGRTIALTGDVTATGVSFDGTGNISLSTTIAANSVALGNDTTGNYVSTIAGTANEIEVTGSGSETATVTVGLPDDVTIAGNLTVNGTTTTVNSDTLNVTDPLIKLAKANSGSDSLDIGFYGLYDTSGSQDLFAGLFRDANDSGKFKLFKDLQVEPTTTVNTSGTGYAVGTLVANLEGNVTGAVTGNASTASALETARAIALSGDVVGTANFDGSAGISITTAIQANSVALGTDTTGNYVSAIAGTSNEIEVSGSGSETASVTIGLPNDVTISNDLTVSGDLIVTGTTTQTGSVVTDSNFQGFTDGNTGNVTDFGFYGKYVESSTTKYAGLFYDSSTDNTFRLFVDTQTKPTTTVNTGATGYAVASLVANLTGNVTGNADTATALATARSIALGGDLGGSANFDGSGNITITSTIQSDAVEQSMIADDAVGADQIADNSVDIARLNVSDGSNGQVLTTDGSGSMSFQTVSAPSQTLTVVGRAANVAITITSGVLGVIARTGTINVGV